LSSNDVSIHRLLVRRKLRGDSRQHSVDVRPTARAINRATGSCDDVFADRYHSSQIRTASYARHALAYVLNNWRRHREARARAAAGLIAEDMAVTRRLEGARRDRSAGAPRATVVAR